MILSKIMENIFSTIKMFIPFFVSFLVNLSRRLVGERIVWPDLRRSLSSTFSHISPLKSSRLKPYLIWNLPVCREQKFLPVVLFT